MKIFQAKIVNDETPVRSPEPLKIGDVVRLKSGGPLMTVVRFTHDGDPLCTWFDYSGESMIHHKFPIAATNAAGKAAACLDVYEPDNKGD